MLPTYEKIILASKGFKIIKDKTYVILGANEYEILDDELAAFLKEAGSEEYVSLIIEN